MSVRDGSSDGSTPDLLLASLLTDVKGASHAFGRGFVVYIEDAKCELLGIRSERLEACGAVSREGAVAMAEGAIERSHADIALAVTGYAGAAPPGEGAGPVPLACGRRGDRNSGGQGKSVSGRADYRRRWASQQTTKPTTK